MCLGNDEERDSLFIICLFFLVSTRVLRMADILGEDNAVSNTNQKANPKKVVAAQGNAKL